MFHMLAWAVSQTNNVATDMTPVPDQMFLIQNNHFVPQKDLFVFGACYMNVDAARARWITPSLRQITTPYIRPVEGNLTPGSRPGVADYRLSPLRLKALEEIQVEAFQDGAGAANGCVVAVIGDGPIIPAPMGDPYKMRGTATTAAVANSWTLLAPTWQDALPAGLYACIGFECISATAKAARLIFEEQPWRPGSVSMNDPENFTHPMFVNGGLGVLGRFTANRMPNIEVLCNTTDSSHEFYLDFVKIG